MMGAPRVYGWRRASVSAVMGIMLLSGCAWESGPRPPASTTRAALSVSAARELVPTAIPGSAVSVLQVNHTTWMTMATSHGLAVRTWTKGVAQAVVTLPIPLSCVAAGTLLHLGPVIGVAGCTAIWTPQGTTWEALRLPAVLMPEAMAGVGSDWSLLSIGAGAAGSQEVSIWHSTTAGHTWIRVGTSGIGLTPPAPGPPPFYGDKTGLAMASRHDLWLTGSVAGGILLDRSEDTGGEWQSVSIPVPAVWAGAELASYPPIFATAQRGYLPVSVESRHFTGLAIYETRPPQEAWRLAGAISTSLAVALSNEWTLGTAGTSAVWLVLPHQVWQSTDRVRHWRVALRLAAPWTIMDISFSGAHDGALLAVRRQGTPPTSVDYALWQTVNGGQTWTAVSSRA